MEKLNKESILGDINSGAYENAIEKIVDKINELIENTENVSEWTVKRHPETFPCKGCGYNFVSKDINQFGYCEDCN